MLTNQESVFGAIKCGVQLMPRTLADRKSKDRMVHNTKDRVLMHAEGSEKSSERCNACVGFWRMHKSFPSVWVVYRTLQSRKNWCLCDLSLPKSKVKGGLTESLQLPSLNQESPPCPSLKFFPNFSLSSSYFSCFHCKFNGSFAISSR